VAQNLKSTVCQVLCIRSFYLPLTSQ